MRTNLTFALLLSAFFVFGQNKTYLTESNIKIFKDKQTTNLVFDRRYTKATLIGKDIRLIDSLLIAAIDNYNSKFDTVGNEIAISTNGRNYRFQLIAATNIDGEKIVWVNAFCNTSIFNWKDKPVVVYDGGSCYFNLKINVTKRTYFDLYVNGVAQNCIQQGHLCYGACRPFVPAAFYGATQTPGTTGL
jgi:hypothetical protein